MNPVRQKQGLQRGGNAVYQRVGGMEHQPLDLMTFEEDSSAQAENLSDEPLGGSDCELQRLGIASPAITRSRASLNQHVYQPGWARISCLRALFSTHFQSDTSVGFGVASPS